MEIVIGNVLYKVVAESKFSNLNRTELTLKRPNGKRTYHAVRYEDGTISEAV